MGKNTNQIATWGDLGDLAGCWGGTSHGYASGTFFKNYDKYVANKCPTKQDILDTGRFSVSGTYASNQCVRYSDISLSFSVTWTFKVEENITASASTDWAEIRYVTGSTTTVIKRWSLSNTNKSQSWTYTYTPTKAFLSSDWFEYAVGSTTWKHDWYSRTLGDDNVWHGGPTNVVDRVAQDAYSAKTTINPVQACMLKGWSLCIW